MEEKVNLTSQSLNKYPSLIWGFEISNSEESIDRPIDRRTDRPTDRPTNRPTNQPTNQQSITYSLLTVSLKCKQVQCNLMYEDVCYFSGPAWLSGKVCGSLSRGHGFELYRILWVFRGSVREQDTSEPQPSTGET